MFKSFNNLEKNPGDFKLINFYFLFLEINYKKSNIDELETVRGG